VGASLCRWSQLRHFSFPLLTAQVRQHFLKITSPHHHTLS
jgi:hypothetical protein